jgi:hypothetical protein
MAAERAREHVEDKAPPPEQKQAADLPKPNADGTWTIKGILRHKGAGENREFLTWWDGFQQSEATWEPRTSFGDPHWIKEYEAKVLAANKVVT